MLIERIVGVDFGTSTSVIRVKRYQDGRPMIDKLHTMSVQFNMGNSMVPSLVQKNLETGETTCFGYAAQTAHRGTETFSNFKAHLEDKDDGVRNQARSLTKAYLTFLAGEYNKQSTAGFLGDATDYHTNFQ